MSTADNPFCNLPVEVNLMILKKLNNLSDGLSFLKVIPYKIRTTFNDWLHLMLRNNSKENWPVQKLMCIMDIVDIANTIHGRCNLVVSGKDFAERSNYVLLMKKKRLLNMLFENTATVVNFLAPIDRIVVRNGADKKKAKRRQFSISSDYIFFGRCLNYHPSQLLMIFKNTVVCFHRRAFYLIFNKSVDIKAPLPQEVAENLDFLYGGFGLECTIGAFETRCAFFVICRIRGNMIILVSFNDQRLEVHTLFHLDLEHDVDDVDLREHIEFKQYERCLFVYLRKLKKIFVYNLYTSTTYYYNNVHYYTASAAKIRGVYVHCCLRINERDEVYALDGEMPVFEKNVTLGERKDESRHVRMSTVSFDEKDDNNQIEIFHELLLNRLPVFEDALIGSGVKKLYVIEDRYVLLYFRCGNGYVVEYSSALQEQK